MYALMMPKNKEDKGMEEIVWKPPTPKAQVSW